MSEGAVRRLMSLALCLSLAGVTGVAWAQDGAKPVAEEPAAEGKKSKKEKEAAEKKRKEEEEKKIKQTKETLEKVREHVKKYFDTNLRLPEALALLTKAPNPVVSSVPVDAWGKAFQYTMGAYSFEKQEFTLVSGGPDGKIGTADDIKLVNEK